MAEMFKNILFIEDEDASGTDQPVIGTLTPAGKWTGDKRLEFDVRRTMRRLKTDLHNPDSRRELLMAFGGTFLFAIEE